VVARGGDVGDEPVLGQRALLVGEDALGDPARLVVAEALLVPVQLGLGGGAHGQQVARRAHLEGGAVGDARQRLVDVAGGEQVGGGGEHVLQPFGHRVELAAQGLGVLAAGAGRPGDAVAALGVAARLADVVLDGGRLEAEELGGRREQARRPGAVQRVAGEAGVGGRADDGAAGVHLDGLQRGDRAEAVRGDRHLAQERLGRSQRAQRGGGHRRAQRLDGVGADVEGEVLLAGDRGARFEERDGLVVGEPVGDVGEVLDGARAARIAQQPAHRLAPGDARHAGDQRRRERAAEVVAVREVARH
jgi:hypothetical protein